MTALRMATLPVSAGVVRARQQAGRWRSLVHGLDEHEGPREEPDSRLICQALGTQTRGARETSLSPETHDLPLPQAHVPASGSSPDTGSGGWVGRQDNPVLPPSASACMPGVHRSVAHAAATGSGNGGDGNPIYGALDLGTNNCRLLLARPSRRGIRVVDAFSRIIRLGEGVSQTGRLSRDAMQRTRDALRVCASKISKANVRRARLVATEACRVAENGREFLAEVRDELGLEIELLSREDEARLAVSGCASLIDASSDHVLVFDIGGGSSELIWLDLTRRREWGRNPFANRIEAQHCMAAWTSLPLGVVTLAERFGGRNVTPSQFEEMVAHVLRMLEPFGREVRIAEQAGSGKLHFLGTSGTVTTVAGIQLGLERYDRSKVDGCWLDVADVQRVTGGLLSQSYDERVAQPCIGRDRADLVLAGCAILEALLRMWPCDRLRVADRGLREGILMTLMSEDGVHRGGGRRRLRGRGGP